MQSHHIEFRHHRLATVKIDESNPNALESIKEMVDFWSGAAERLFWANGDYIRAWLSQLAEFIMENQRAPIGWHEGMEDTGLGGKFDEGWNDIEHGHFGIKLMSVRVYEFSGDDFDFIRVG